MSDPSPFMTYREECERLRTELADAIARISWQDAEIEGLRKQIKVKDLKFDRLCKDMDARNEYAEELKRIISNNLVVIEAAQNLIEQRGRYNSEIAYKRLEETLKAFK